MSQTHQYPPRAPARPKAPSAPAPSSHSPSPHPSESGAGAVTDNAARGQGPPPEAPPPAPNPATAHRGGLRRFIFHPWTVFLALLLGAGGIILASGAIGGGGDDDEQEGGAADRPQTAVEVADVVATDLRQMVRGVGTLRTVRRVEIRPERAGRLLAVHFEDGSLVDENDLLFEFDARQLQRQRQAAEAALEAANARLSSAEIRFRRARDLHQRRAATDDELDQARADRDAAAAEVRRLEAELDLIDEQLADTRLHAPFDGLISARMVDPGSYVSIGDVLATLYQVDPLEISFGVPERHIGRVRPEQTVQVLVAAYPQQPFEGQVRYVSPSIDQATRTFEVRARVANPDHQLKPGGFAAAAVVIATLQDRPVIPEEALVATREGYVVFTVEPGQAQTPTVRMQPVRLGLRQQGLVEITEGLEPGQRIVRFGHMQLDEGDAVRIVEDHGPGWLEALTRPAIEPPQR